MLPEMLEITISQTLEIMPIPWCFLRHIRRKLKKVWSLWSCVSLPCSVQSECESNLSAAVSKWRWFPSLQPNKHPQERAILQSGSSFRFHLVPTSPQRMCRETPFSPYWTLPVSIPVHKLEPSCLHFKLSLKIWAKYDGFVDNCLGKEVLQGIHYTTGWRLMPKYCKTHGVSRRSLTWNMWWRSSMGCRSHGTLERQIWNGSYWGQWWPQKE